MGSSRRAIFLVVFILVTCGFLGTATTPESPPSKDKKFQRFLFKFQTAFFRFSLPDNFPSIFFPTAAVQIRLVENLNVRHFRQRLIKRSALIRVDRANEKCDVVLGPPPVRMAPSSSNGSSTLTDFPFTSSERKFALFDRPSLPPPKNGRVCMLGELGISLRPKAARVRSATL